MRTLPASFILNVRHGASGVDSSLPPGPRNGTFLTLAEPSLVETLQAFAVPVAATLKGATRCNTAEVCANRLK